MSPFVDKKQIDKINLTAYNSIQEILKRRRSMVGKPRILVVDDERSIRECLSMILEDDGYVVITAKDGEDGLQKIKELGIDVVILDVWLPKMKGTQVLKEILAIKKNLPVIMISGHADIETTVELLKNGAVDFIEKPLIKGKILVTVKNALMLRILAKENEQLKQENENLREILNKVYDLKGNSKIIVELRKKILRAAKTNFNVLIQGTSDIDMELIAHMIHLQSHKSGAPFVEVNCASRDEIFGNDLSSGNLERAKQGTLFLHKIDNLDLATQEKILPLFQHNEFYHLDGDKKIKVTQRIIVSSSKNLREKVLEKSFREDLYYQLKDIVITVPSLNGLSS